MWHYAVVVSRTCACIPGPPVFLRVTLKNWEWPGDEAMSLVLTCVISPAHAYRTSITHTSCSIVTIYNAWSTSMQASPCRHVCTLYFLYSLGIRHMLDLQSLHIKCQSGIFLGIFRRGGGRLTEKHALDVTNVRGLEHALLCILHSCRTYCGS